MKETLASAPGLRLVIEQVFLSSECLAEVLSDCLEQVHRELVSGGERSLLDLFVEQPQFRALGFLGEGDESLHDGDAVHLVLLDGTVPHHVDLSCSRSIVCVQELQEELALLDDLSVSGLAKQHVEQVVAVHPVDQQVLRQPPLPHRL